MIATIQSYVRQGRSLLRRWTVDPLFHTVLRISACLLSAFALSAASLGNYPQPLVLGMVCAASGWSALLMALGGCAGYLLFWGSSGYQCAACLAGGLLIAMLLGGRSIVKTAPLLVPALAGVLTAVTGLFFQVYLGDTAPVLIYGLRIVLASAGTALFLRLSQRSDPVTQWLCCGVFVLALAQISPFPWLSLGCLAAGALCASGAFPAAALAGLALDLAQISSVPLTAVTCITYFLRLIPRIPSRLVLAAPGIVYLLVMGLCGKWDLMPLPAWILGGFAGYFLPGQQVISRRRGGTGIAQVRLEMVSGVFSQAQQLLLEAASPPIDEAALLQRATERACGSCPCRKSCRSREAAAGMPSTLLHRPLLDGGDLPISCRKEGRLLQELHRAQEQLRSLRADRQRLKEYRSALIQQYQFLSEYLQDLSDELGKRTSSTLPRYTPQVLFRSNRPQSENGDCCQCFAGTGCRYYVLLCDGMGSGLGAASESTAAAGILRKLLLAGFPGEYALRSLNSLCALRGIAGVVTADLAELQLDTGKAVLYKWGAAPSYLLSSVGAEKIGTAGPPPGLSVEESRETTERLSLRRGEMLVLLSDGVGGEESLRLAFAEPVESPEALADRLLLSGSQDRADDATVAVVRLTPESMSAS